MQLDIKSSQAAVDKADMKADPIISQLKVMTPAQAAAYVQTNVTDLASAKAMLKTFAKILVVLAKDIK